MQSTLAQAGGSFKSRGETCRQLRPRQQIGIETIGRRAIWIPSILHGLTIRDFFLRVRTGFGCLEKKRQPTDGVWTVHPQIQHVQSCTAYHISSREHARLKIKDCTSLCPKNNWHPRVMSHSLPHLTLTTSTSSFSPLSSTSPIFPTVSPSQTSPKMFNP